MLDYKLENKIKSIELSYLFAKNLKHGINENDCWQLFEPSKFIYSFFAFNMIYEIDWKSTFSKNRIWDQRGIYTHTKIYALIEFLNESNNKKDFYSTYKKFGSIKHLINNVNNIQPDQNISRVNNCEKLAFKESFFNNYITSINNLKIDNLGLTDHYHLLAFTYQIRNNIFHGQKTLGMMTLKEQRERLIDYTNIILTTLEQFFDMLSIDYGYFRAHKGELSENINLE